MCREEEKSFSQLRFLGRDPINGTDERLITERHTCLFNTNFICYKSLNEEMKACRYGFKPEHFYTSCDENGKSWENVMEQKENELMVVI